MRILNADEFINALVDLMHKHMSKIRESDPDMAIAIAKVYTTVIALAETFPAPDSNEYVTLADSLSCIKSYIDLMNNYKHTSTDILADLKEAIGRTNHSNT